ncbi:hypothetical protein Tco_1188564, partial [Tanacetum coccineum]
YDFFAPAPLPGYVGNPNNNNGWLEADDYLLGALEAMVDEQMVVSAIKEVAEPVAEAEEEQVIAPAVDMEEGQMDVPVMDMEDDLAALFSDDDASDGFDGEEVWEVNEEWLMAPTTPPSMLAVPPPSVYEDLSTRLGNLEYGHGQLVQRVKYVSDAEVAVGVTIEELGPRVYAVEGQVQVIVSQMAYAAGRWEQVGAQVKQGQQTAAQRDETIAELTQQVQALQIDV